MPLKVLNLVFLLLKKYLFDSVRISVKTILQNFNDELLIEEVSPNFLETIN